MTWTKKIWPSKVNVALYAWVNMWICARYWRYERNRLCCCSNFFYCLFSYIQANRRQICSDGILFMYTFKMKTDKWNEVFVDTAQKEFLGKKMIKTTPKHDQFQFYLITLFPMHIFFSISIRIKWILLIFKILFSFYLSIFDRWLYKIFEWNFLNKNDGSYQARSPQLAQYERGSRHEFIQ